MNASGIGGGYLRHVDGLRGVSVLLVVLYHAWPDAFPGGFIGVDVFFVISGFLITRLLLAERAAGRVSYRRFLMRRVRRLWPSFALVLAFTLGIGWILLDAAALADLGRTALAAIGLSSNWYFALTADYFNEGLGQNLLLHSWSLAVEEQFYLVYPMLLIGVARVRGGLALALGLLWGTSFAGVMIFGATSEAFFATHLRVWQLASGALLWCAVERGMTARISVVQGAWLGGLGLLTVVLTALLLPRAIWWPNAFAILPVVGAVLSIGFRWRGLEVRWLVGLGLISYALYLWHWPLLQGLNTLTPRAPDGIIAAVVALSVGVSWLAWRYVEEPIRRKRRVKAPARLLALAGGVSLLLGLVSWQYHAQDGFPERFPDNLAAIAATGPDQRSDWLVCERGLAPLADLYELALPVDKPLIDNEDIEICTLRNRGSQAPNILYVGDSHLGAMSREVSRRASGQEGAGIAFVALAACPPIPGLTWEREGEARAKSCKALKQLVLNVLATGRVDKAVLVAHWDIYAGETETKLPDFGEHFARFVETVIIDTELHVLLDVPTHDFDTPSALVRYQKWPWLGKPNWLTRTRHEEVRSPYLDLMQAAERDGKLVLHDPVPAFCTAEVCLAMTDAGPLFYDSSHVSEAGARFLLDALPDLPQ